MLLDQYNKIKIYPEAVILAYIQKYISDNYEYKTNEKGHWINVPSPFYDDKRKRLGFNLDTGIIFDFKLQKGWDLESFIIKHSKEVLHTNICTKEKAENFLFLLRSELRRNKKDGLELQSVVRQTFQEEGAQQLPELNELEIPVGLQSFDKEKILRNRMGRKAILYLQSRNFTSSMIKDFNLQYIDQENCPVCQGKKFDENGDKCPECKGWGKYKFHGRIYIPTHEEGRLVYYQARDYLDRDKKWKYLNPKVPRRQVVFFYDRLPKNDRIFGPEGPFDAMFLYKYPATALMGNKVSKAFVEKILWKRPKEFIFIPDFDKKLETRKQIFSNLIYNMNKIKDEAPYPIDIGVYNWFSLTSAKDLNAGGIDYVDDGRLIFPFKDKLKFKDMIREVLKRPE